MWVMDNSTGAVMAAGSIALSEGVCLEACTSSSYTRGACGLADSNVGEWHMSCMPWTIVRRLEHFERLGGEWQLLNMQVMLLGLPHQESEMWVVSAA